MNFKCNNQLQFSNYANLGALSTRNMSKFSLARAVGVTAEGSADAAVAPAAAAAVDEVGEITLEQKGALGRKGTENCSHEPTNRFSCHFLPIPDNQLSLYVLTLLLLRPLC